MSDVLLKAAPSPFTIHVTRTLRLVVPDEWYRRAKTRALSTASTEPSEATIKALQEMEENDEADSDDGNGEGTAKQKSTSSKANE